MFTPTISDVRKRSETITKRTALDFITNSGIMWHTNVNDQFGGPTTLPSTKWQKARKPAKYHHRSWLQLYVHPVTVLLTILGAGKLRLKKKLAFLKYAYMGVSLVIGTVQMLAIVYFIWYLSQKGQSLQIRCVQIAVISWTIQVLAAEATSVYLHNGGRLGQLWRLAYEVDADDMLNSTGFLRRFRRSAVVCTVLMLAYCLITVLRHLLAFAGYLSYQGQPTLAIVEDSPKLLTALVAHGLMCWFAMQLFYLLVCSYLEKAWRAMATVMQMKHRDKELFERLIDWSLRKHLSLTKLTRHVSRAFSCYSALMLTASVPTLIVELYVIGVSDDAGLQFNLSMWSISAFLQLCIICYAGYINSAAMLAKDHFYESYTLNVAYSDDDGDGSSSATTLILLQKADTLACRLQQADVGIDICGIFVITKAFFFTMLSTVFNYFFLLTQFAMDEYRKLQYVENITMNATCQTR